MRSRSPIWFNIGLLGLGLLLGLGSAYLLLVALFELQAAMQRQSVAVTFNNSLLFIPGALVTFAALVMIALVRILKPKLQQRFESVGQVAIIVGVFLGFGGRIAGRFVVDHVVQSHGYSHCATKDNYQPRRERRGWVIDPALCNINLPVDHLTLPELKKLLRGDAANALP